MQTWPSSLIINSLRAATGLLFQGLKLNLDVNLNMKNKIARSNPSAFQPRKETTLMKQRLIQVAGFLALALTFAVSEANAQAVCFYQDAYYRGRAFCLNENTTAGDLVAYQMNDMVSSVYFFRPANITVCEHSYMGGRCLNLNSNVPDLVPFGFNDFMSSVQVRSNGGYPLPPPPPPPYPNPNPGPVPPPNGQVCLFEHSYFQGRAVCLSRGQQILDLGRNGFNDTASSIRFSGQGRITICSDNGLRGICRNVYEPISDFVQIGMNDMVTSIRVD